MKSGPVTLLRTISSGLPNARRQEIEGFGYEDCQVFRGDAVRQAITWNGRSLDELAGEVIRLDFYLQDADLFTFLAGRNEPQ